MACHTMNLPFMALNLANPTSVVAESSGIVENETYPRWSVITYQFGQRGELPPITMKWYDGRERYPAMELFRGQPISGSGSLFVGSEGTLYSPSDYGGEYKLLPEDQFREYRKPEPTIARSPGHFREFADACRGGTPAMSNFDYAGPLTEMILLGNVALKAGSRIEWDAENLRVTNNEAANSFLRREYREGWTL